MGRHQDELVAAPLGDLTDQRIEGCRGQVVLGLLDQHDVRIGDTSVQCQHYLEDVLASVAYVLKRKVVEMGDKTALPCSSLRNVDRERQIAVGDFALRLGQCAIYCRDRRVGRELLSQTAICPRELDSLNRIEMLADDLLQIVVGAAMELDGGGIDA